MSMEKQTSANEVSQDSASSTLAWYKPKLGSRLTPIMRDIFVNYSGIPAEDIEQHVYEVRERAWELYKYPTIGQWQFLYSATPSFPWYPTLLADVRHGAPILDLGCCFAQDLRILAIEGAPTENMYASDILGDYWEMGLDLFRDRQKMQAHFLEADIFDSSSALGQLKGKMQFVIAAHFFHLFSYDKQVQAFKEAAKLLKPGGSITGNHIGLRKPREMAAGQTKGSASADSKYYHNEESFRRMWQQIEMETNSSWIVQVHLQPLSEWYMPKEDYAWMGPDARGLSFFVTMRT